MKELKFRVWRYKEKEMWVTLNSLIFEGNELKRVILFESGNKMICDEIRDVCLMQYTGLKDKNNTDIYEDDLLECNYDDYFNTHDKNYPNNNKFRFYVEYYDIKNIPKDVEIIGNRFQLSKLP